MSGEEKQLKLWDNKRYYSLNYHLRQRFGRKMFKVALDAGFTCPNRDGTLSFQGCFFCSPRGSGDFAGQRGVELERQFEDIKQMMQGKWPQAGYIAYFQAFTNTYAPPDVLNSLYHRALKLEGVQGIAIATRPDCLEDEVIEVLKRINSSTYLWIELGLQTMHEASAHRFNLGYTYRDFVSALERLCAANIETCAHLVLGLPGENRQDMLASAREVAKLPLKGIKLHLLHLMKNTPLAGLYRERPFPFLEMDEYVDLVIDILELLPQEMVIHRLTGDSPRETLIGPTWSLKKWEVLNAIDRRLEARNTWQGKRCV